MKKVFLAVFLLGLLLATGCVAQTTVTDPFGTVTVPEGYYHWQYNVYSHTATVVLESGLSQAGRHLFNIQLPQQMLIHEIHAVHDFAPWCVGAGFEVLIRASEAAGGPTTDALLGDKTFSGGQPELHTTFNADFSRTTGGGVPMRQITFDYFMDSNCVVATDSWTINFVIN